MKISNFKFYREHGTPRNCIAVLCNEKRRFVQEWKGVASIIGAFIELPNSSLIEHTTARYGKLEATTWGAVASQPGEEESHAGS